MFCCRRFQTSACLPRVQGKRTTVRKVQKTTKVRKVLSPLVENCGKLQTIKLIKSSHIPVWQWRTKTKGKALPLKVLILPEQWVHLQYRAPSGPRVPAITNGLVTPQPNMTMCLKMGKANMFRHRGIATAGWGLWVKSLFKNMEWLMRKLSHVRSGIMPLRIN